KEAAALLTAHQTPVEKLPAALKPIKSRYKLTTLDVVEQPIGDGTKEKVKVHGAINPEGDTPFIEFVHGMPRADLKFAHGEYDEGEYKRQIKDQETGLRSMKVAQWRTNRNGFLSRAATSDSGRHPQSDSAQSRARRIVITALTIAEVRRRTEAGETVKSSDV